MTFPAFSLLNPAQILAAVLNPIIFTHGEKRMNVWGLESVKGPREKPSQDFIHLIKIDFSITDLLIKPRNAGHKRTAA